jgi:hypothetical protein
MFGKGWVYEEGDILRLAEYRLARNKPAELAQYSAASFTTRADLRETEKVPLPEEPYPVHLPKITHDNPLPVYFPGMSVKITPDEDLPPYDDEDETILRTLARYPSRLLTQGRISRLSSEISRPTVGNRLPALIALGLVVQPKGPKCGVGITKKGLHFLSQIDAAKVLP